MHEVLIPQDEARNVLEFEDHFIIKPIQTFWGNKIGVHGGSPCSDDFIYAVIKTAFGFPKMNSGFY